MEARQTLTIFEGALALIARLLRRSALLKVFRLLKTTQAANIRLANHSAIDGISTSTGCLWSEQQYPAAHHLSD
jgi:hypothetical protein